MKLICNADDFGLSKGVNLGIIEAYKHGIVRSTTMMAGGYAFGDAVTLARENPDLKIGVHLTLTSGVSVGGVYETLTDKDGRFHSLAYVEENYEKLDLDEVEAEYETQIGKIMKAGIEIDHFDSHHHTHNLPGIIDIFLKLAKKYGVNARIADKSLLTGKYSSIKSTTLYSQDFYADGVTRDNLKNLCTSSTEGSMEIMCHPAYVDYTLIQNSSYNMKRAEELDVLTSYEMKVCVNENNISLCSFSDL